VDAQFIFDVGSPNAYLAHKVLPAIERRTGGAFVYEPCLLGGIFKATGNQSPMTAYSGVPAKLAYEQNEMRRFIAKHQIEFEFNPHFPVNTLLAMRCAVSAQSLGVAARYVDAVMDAMWRRPRKLDDRDVLHSVLSEAGLPAIEILAAAETPEIKARLIANTERAVARGVFGAPTFFVGEEMYFGKDRLREVEEAMAA